MDDGRFHLCGLELRPQRELKVPFAAFGCNLAERGTRRIEIHAATAGATPVRVVPDVEGFGAELEVYPLIHRNLLEQTHVPVLESRLIDDVANSLSDKRSGGWLGKVGSAADPLTGFSKCMRRAELAIPRKILAAGDAATEVCVQTHAGEVLLLRRAGSLRPDPRR